MSGHASKRLNVFVRVEMAPLIGLAFLINLTLVDFILFSWCRWTLDKIVPLKRVLSHLIDDPRIGPDLTVYFSDLSQGVSTVLSDLSDLLRC